MNMLKAKLNKKLGKNGGFTLVEMLIVVAIIAILVAVSIPLVSSSLEKARKATDDANERSAKAEAVIQYLDAQTNGSAEYVGTFWYDAANGTLIDSAGTGAAKPTAYGKVSGNTTNIIQVVIATGGKVTISWIAGA